MRERDARAVVAVALFACCVAAVTGADEWVAPAEERARSNPVAESPEALRKGRALFQRRWKRVRSFVDPGGNDRYRGYLPKELQTTRSFTRDADPNMTLSYAFKTELFWIVSRANNCHY